jgi:hypothetical protein
MTLRYKALQISGKPNHYTAGFSYLPPDGYRSLTTEELSSLNIPKRGDPFIELTTCILLFVAGWTAGIVTVAICLGVLK